VVGFEVDGVFGAWVSGLGACVMDQGDREEAFGEGIGIRAVVHLCDSYQRCQGIETWMCGRRTGCVMTTRCRGLGHIPNY